MNVDSLCPLDGRYQAQMAPLRATAGPLAFFRYRSLVELAWLEEVAAQLGRPVKLPQIPQEQWQPLFDRHLVLESATKHDVKAVELTLREWLTTQGHASVVEWLHWGLTSEDVNNAAYGLLLQESISRVVLPQLQEVLSLMSEMAREHSDVPMLSKTHGQDATPTTLGKELRVFAKRLESPVSQLQTWRPSIKWSGATGSYNSWRVSSPDVPWPQVAKNFVNQRLKADFCSVATQIEPGDRGAELAYCLMRAHNVLIDASRDFWLYIGRGLLIQANRAGEIGSSTMPHKINPIYFENAEGNLAIANSLLNLLGDTLTKSRMQRDLSGSTVSRNWGMALGYGLQALISFKEGLNRVTVHRQACLDEFVDSYELLAEAVMNTLRTYNVPNSYDLIKGKARGQKWNKALYNEIVESLPIDPIAKHRLLLLTPTTYLGFASELASRA